MLFTISWGSEEKSGPSLLSGHFLRVFFNFNCDAEPVNVNIFCSYFNTLIFHIFDKFFRLFKEILYKKVPCRSALFYKPQSI